MISLTFAIIYGARSNSEVVIKFAQIDNHLLIAKNNSIQVPKVDQVFVRTFPAAESQILCNRL